MHRRLLVVTIVAECKARMHAFAVGRRGSCAVLFTHCYENGRSAPRWLALRPLHAHSCSRSGSVNTRRSRTAPKTRRISIPLQEDDFITGFSTTRKKGGPERPLKWQFDQRTLTCKTPKFGRRDQGLQLRSPEEHARRRARSRLRARHAASEYFTRSARRASDDADKGANQNRSL